MSQSGVSVWGTGDGVRVEPTTGRYLEERTDIHADYPHGDYRGRNGVWDGTAVCIDWTDYDARVGPYLDGSAFGEANGYWGPGVGLYVDHLLLPFDAERGEQTERAWPMVTPPEGPTAEYEAVWVEAARQVRRHFDAHPEWASVERIVFIDALDESYNEAAYRKMIYYCCGYCDLAQRPRRLGRRADRGRGPAAVTIRLNRKPRGGGGGR